MPKSRQTGAAYEQKAVEYLKKKGYYIVCQNFYSKFGEIDIVAKQGSYYVFVEVRYRSTTEKGHPLETVNATKIQRIKKTAQFFYCRYKIPLETPCRFDMIGILKDEIIHLENAFE